MFLLECYNPLHQIIYVDTLLHRQQNITPDPSVLAAHNDLLPKRTAQKVEGKTAEKADRRYLSQ